MSRIPKWLKVAFTIWMMIWIPVYAGHYGPQNFLWICDLCNFFLLIALWLENSLLFSSQLVAVLIIDVLWSIDVGAAFFTGFHPIGGTGYMFDPETPLYIRLMSLFHVFTPALLIYATIRVGYDRRGWMLQTMITWVVLPLSFLLTSPERDINWIWGPFGKPQTILAPWLYFLICMAAYPLLVYLPTHGLVLLVHRWAKRGTHLRF